MDRIAIVSDIHGNIPALESVLRDIEKRKIDKIICLGDLAGKGPDSDIAIDMIMKNCEIVVKGNWDYLISEVCDSDSLLWHYKKIGEERADYLKNLPLYTEFYMSGKLIRLCHADPKDVFHRVWDSSSVEERIKLFESPKENASEADIIGYGDIHGTYINSFRQKTIFNVGSVGNPLDIPKASYGIIEGEYGAIKESSISINFIRVPYDIERAVELAEKSDMPYIKEYVNEIRTAKYRMSK